MLHRPVLCSRQLSEPEGFTCELQAVGIPGRCRALHAPSSVQNFEPLPSPSPNPLLGPLPPHPTLSCSTTSQVSGCNPPALSQETPPPPPM